MGLERSNGARGSIGKIFRTILTEKLYAVVVEQVDSSGSESDVRKDVRVRLPPTALGWRKMIAVGRPTEESRGSTEQGTS